MNAVFLDRDGVLIEDVNLVVDETQIRLLSGVPQALAQLKAAGFALVVVSNQPVVARGLLDEAGVRRLQDVVAARIRAAGGPDLDAFYFCPHHPQAQLPAYRGPCACRKPAPGLLLQAATDLGLTLTASFMVGDRPSDVAAGAHAGCRTILLQTGRHADPPISGMTPAELALKPNHTCAGLAQAATWILKASMKYEV